LNFNEGISIIFIVKKVILEKSYIEITQELIKVLRKV